ncbi:MULTISPECIES: hypothetical protein [Streptomyces]|uniref:Phosphoglycolate phosphatase-like HAD superfamily hydrolase n=1 Tax=Streptomyces nymphaeiformis TaxID=2663842 RepID=A0A7W7U925_9ACTN|nr:hypothetical protein [Streptomyces nymphaeiformis]MBB4986457.1 phosphoglycolate phosphatase-like HAD superfamily hydrolase [Streptomyces nymphaeiformis]
MPDRTVEMTDTNPDRRRKPAQLAALKDGLPAEKRALAEDLRALFGALGISVRRYAARRHLDASSVTRYLNGERVPPWEFVADLVGTVREVSAPLTPQAEAALRETHRTALKSNRRSSKVQELQDELADVDEESRRIRTRQRALEEALLDRERSLSDSLRRCENLELKLDEQQSAHRADVALWEGEYEQLQSECGDLRQEVLFLQEALAVTRAELIAAEEQCHRLEAELDALAELERPGEGASSLMAALEAADRTASVAELVAVVGDLEARTQQAMARELVSSASRSRRVEEVAALLSGLRQAGLHAHAETAVPALVMTRPVAETAALAAALHRAGFEDGVATLLRSSVELHAPCDIIGLCLGLHRDQLGELAESLLGAAFVVRTVTDVVAVVVWAAGTEVEPATLSALGLAAGHRSAQELAELTVALRNAGRDGHARSLHDAVADRGAAKDVVTTVECFTARGLTEDADRILAATQDRGVSHVLSLVRCLVQAGYGAAAAEIVDRAVERWQVDEIAGLIAALYSTDCFSQASQALMGAMRLSAESTRFLFRYLDDVYPGAEAVVEMVSASGSPERAAYLLTSLDRGGLPSLAEAVFQQTVEQRPTGYAGLFLQVLAVSDAAVMRESALYDRACADPGPEMAPLLLALAAARLFPAVDAVARGCAGSRDPGGLVLLLKRLHHLDHPSQPRAESVVVRIVETVVDGWEVDEQVNLAVALAQAGLAQDADLFTRQASGRPRFRNALRNEQNKHAQKVFSRTFWRKGAPGGE